MWQRRYCYCPCASHGFVLLILFPLLFLCHHVSVAAATTSAASSLPSLNKTQEAIMMNISSVVSNSRWNTTSNPCDWSGVTCSPSGHDSSLVVTNLTLHDFDISFSAIFASICPLETLQFLDLSRNSISTLPDYSFPFPCEMSTGLLRLNLSCNRLPGPLANFHVFLKLEVLDLSFNSFTRGVLNELIYLPKLRSLNLSYNSLEGRIPTSMPLNLKELVLSANQFTGTIPDELFQYKNLTLLDLSQNMLSSDAANDFGRLKKLEILLLSGNNLGGLIPQSLLTLKNLSRFAANNNNFNGSIPTGITKHVKILDLSYNNLSGTIPSDLFSPSGLELVDLTSNQLDGQITGSFSHSLYRLRLGSNFLSGSIPNTIGDALGMTYLELDHNKMVGNIPLQLGNCKNLTLFEPCA